MRRLFSSKENRMIQLIESLYHETEWVTYADLSEKLDCSVRILKDDLTYIEEHFPELTLTTSYQGIHLRFDKNIGISHIYQKFLRQSEAFRLLDKIFTEETLHDDEISDYLFISLSTLRRLCKKINSYLEEYFSIQLDLKKIFVIFITVYIRKAIRFLSGLFPM